MPEVLSFFALFGSFPYLYSEVPTLSRWNASTEWPVAPSSAAFRPPLLLFSTVRHFYSHESL